MFLPPQGEQLADPLLAVLRGVEYRGVRTDPAADHSEQIDPADVGVGQGLEHQRGERSVGVACSLFLCPALLEHRDRWTVQRRRERLDHELRQAIDAGRPAGRPHQDRDELRLAQPRLDPMHDLLG